MRASAIVLLIACAAACATDPDDEAGTAPSIDMLALQPEQVALGTPTAVHGDVAFVDPDGDVETIEIELTDHAGASTSMDVAVTGSHGVEAGTVRFMLVVTPPRAGTYPLAVRVIDAEGNASAPARAELRAQ